MCTTLALGLLRRRITVRVGLSLHDGRRWSLPIIWSQFISKTKAIKVNHTWSTSVQMIWDRPFDFGRHPFSSQRSDAYQLPSEEKKERGRTYFLLARGTSLSSSSWIKAVVVAFQVGLQLQENSGQGQKWTRKPFIRVFLPCRDRRG